MAATRPATGLSASAHPGSTSSFNGRAATKDHPTVVHGVRPHPTGALRLTGERHPPPAHAVLSPLTVHEETHAMPSGPPAHVRSGQDRLPPSLIFFLETVHEVA